MKARGVASDAIPDDFLARQGTRSRLSEPLNRIADRGNKLQPQIVRFPGEKSPRDGTKRSCC
jgi:hypothetical protein